MTVDLWQLVEEAVSPLGLDVLEVHFARGELLVRLERKDERPITVADLEEASRHIEAALDREDPIPGSYRLLVESPGPKRPLFTRRHFERFQGLKAKVLDIADDAGLDAHRVLQPRHRGLPALLGAIDQPLV